MMNLFFSKIRGKIYCVAYLLYLYSVWPVYDVKGLVKEGSISIFDSYDLSNDIKIKDLVI